MINNVPFLLGFVQPVLSFVSCPVLFLDLFSSFGPACLVEFLSFCLVKFLYFFMFVFQFCKLCLVISRLVRLCLFWLCTSSFILLSLVKVCQASLPCSGFMLDFFTFSFDPSCVQDHPLVPTSLYRKFYIASYTVLCTHSPNEKKKYI